jgi:hypothetical protein
MRDSGAPTAGPLPAGHAVSVKFPSCAVAPPASRLHPGLLATFLNEVEQDDDV